MFFSLSEQLLFLHTIPSIHALLVKFLKALHVDKTQWCNFYNMLCVQRYSLLEHL